MKSRAAKLKKSDESAYPLEKCCENGGRVGDGIDYYYYYYYYVNRKAKLSFNSSQLCQSVGASRSKKVGWMTAGLASRSCRCGDPVVGD